MSTRQKLILYMVAASVLFSGCGGGKERAGKKTEGGHGIDYMAIQKKAEKFQTEPGDIGGTMILSSFSDPKSFNPITSTETTTSEFTAYMYSGLVEIDGVSGMPVPGMAKSWDISEDGITWTFHIREGILWSDSTPFSAYDVVFTFNRLIYNDEINPNSSRDFFIINGKEIKVSAVDSLTVRFELPVPFAPFLRSMSQEILPKHAYEHLVENGEFSNSLGIKTSPEDMVGTGPFMLESYMSSQKVVLKRNPNFWKKDSRGKTLPYLDKIVYMIVSDRNAELLRFKRSEIDFLSAKGEDYPGLKRDEENGGYRVFRLGPARGSNFLFFNQNTGVSRKSEKPYVAPYKLKWFRSAAFRKAVAFALDKENMINVVMNGLGYPQWSPMSPSEGYYYTSDVNKYPYNIEKALEILRSEGFTDSDSDGVIEDKEGNPVEFSFITNSGNNVRLQLAEIIRKDLEKLGFKVHFQQVEFNTLVQKIDNPPFAWEAVLIGLTGGPEPHFGKNVWHSSGSLHMWFPRQERPSSEWEATIDSLFEAGARELDREKRKETYVRWQKIASDKLPLIYTVLPERILCISDKFGNINPSMNGGVLHNIEHIYIKE